MITLLALNQKISNYTWRFYTGCLVTNVKEFTFVDSGATLKVKIRLKSGMKQLCYRLCFLVIDYS